MALLSLEATNGITPPTLRMEVKCFAAQALAQADSCMSPNIRSSPAVPSSSPAPHTQDKVCSSVHAVVSSWNDLTSSNVISSMKPSRAYPCNRILPVLCPKVPSAGLHHSSGYSFIII